MKLTISKVDAAVRKLRKKYAAQGKNKEWLDGWERGFRKVYDHPTKEKDK